jgi:hypothetical protein
MELNWWKFQILGNITIFYFKSLFNIHAFDDLCGVRTGSDGRSTSKSFENSS